MPVSITINQPTQPYPEYPKAYDPFAYGNDNRIVLSGQYLKHADRRTRLLYAALNSCQPPAPHVTRTTTAISPKSLTSRSAAAAPLYGHGTTCASHDNTLLQQIRRHVRSTHTATTRWSSTHGLRCNAGDLIAIGEENGGSVSAHTQNGARRGLPIAGLQLASQGAILTIAFTTAGRAEDAEFPSTTFQPR